MARLIEFNSARLLDEYCQQLDERLKNILRILALEMGGIRITCLVRTPEENYALIVQGAVPHSKHLINTTTGKCEAADINPRRNYTQEADAWRNKVKHYLDFHTNGINTVIHGKHPHVHIEIDPVPGFGVELV